MLSSEMSTFYRCFAEAYPEVIFKTERIAKRMEEIRVETERLRHEAEERVAQMRLEVAENLEPTISVKNEIIEKLGGKKYTIQRSKGLGENEPDMMWRTTMCPQTRRLIAVTSSDAEETARMFDVLLGDAIAERKKFITENGHLYIKDADI